MAKENGWRWDVEGREEFDIYNDWLEHQLNAANSCSMEEFING
jgi:hypothetical protein